MATEGDSTGAINYLQEVVARDRRDAAAWHKLGVLAWARTRSAGRKQVMSPDVVRLRSVADSALRFATELAPDSGHFWYDLAKYSLNTGNVFVRASADAYVDRGIVAAEKSRDSVLWSRMLDEQGMTAWRAYHDVAHRALMGMVPDYVPDMTVLKNGVAPGTGVATDQKAPGAIPKEVRRDKWAPFLRELLRPPNDFGGRSRSIRSIGSRDSTC
jgi:hypothetical protein